MIMVNLMITCNLLHTTDISTTIQVPITGLYVVVVV